MSLLLMFLSTTLIKPQKINFFLYKNLLNWIFVGFSFKIIVFIYDRKNSYHAMIVIDLFESIDCIISLKEVFNDYFVAMFTKHAFFD